MSKSLRELAFVSRAAFASIVATGLELVVVKALTGHVPAWALFAGVQIIANLITFLAYKYWAFGVGAHGHAGHQYAKQTVVFGGSWVLNTVIPSLFHYRLGMQPWLAFAASNVITYLGWNYPLNRFWVFRGAVDDKHSYGDAHGA